ncbi:hypothetical protein Tco_0020507 [Tanacetum coccineum]
MAPIPDISRHKDNIPKGKLRRWPNGISGAFPSLRSLSKGVMCRRVDVASLAPLFVSWSIRWFRDSLAYLKLSLGSSIYSVWKLVDTPYRAMWDTTYWGFLGVRTTVDIFQNLRTDTPYLLAGYGVLRQWSFNSSKSWIRRIGLE